MYVNEAVGHIFKFLSHRGCCVCACIQCTCIIKATETVVVCIHIICAIEAIGIPLIYSLFFLYATQFQ